MLCSNLPGDGRPVPLPKPSGCTKSSRTVRWCAAYTTDLQKTIALGTTYRIYHSVQNVAVLSTAPGQVYTSYRAVPTSQITQNVENTNCRNITPSTGHYCTISQCRNVALPQCCTTQLLSCNTAKPSRSMLYGTAITLHKVHCTLSLHQVVGNSSSSCHVAAECVDCSITSGKRVFT